jgi:hypothetical protein
MKITAVLMLAPAAISSLLTGRACLIAATTPRPTRWCSSSVATRPISSCVCNVHRAVCCVLGAILGSLCLPNRQMACLSSSYTARERKFLLSSPLPREINAIRPQAGRQFCFAKLTPAGAIRLMYVLRQKVHLFCPY